jgi:hypothetical protein
MGKVVFREGENVRVIENSEYATEQELQDFLLRFPSLIPLDEAEAAAMPLLPIGWEVTLASGSIDVLYLDASGLLTIAETKLKRNPQWKREVVGQIIEYAASLCEWTVEDVEAQARRFLNSEQAAPGYKGCSLEEAIRKLQQQTLAHGEGELTIAELRARIGDQLRNGRIRLIVAVDEIHEHLRRSITFLNTYSSFSIYLLECTRFADGKDRDLFIPSLFGYARKMRPTKARGQWDEESFLNTLRESSDPVTVQTVMSLYEFAAHAGGTIWWGSGASEGSFTLHYMVNGRRVSVFTAFTSGKLWVNFGYMKDRVPLGVLETFRNELNGIPGVNLPKEVVGGNKWPSISLRFLANDENLTRFQQAVNNLGAALKGDAS